MSFKQQNVHFLYFLIGVGSSLVKFKFQVPFSTWAISWYTGAPAPVIAKFDVLTTTAANYRRS